MYKSINPSELNSSMNIIDIRSREAYNRSHIPNAKNITTESLLIRPEKYLNKYETYYLYCQKGIQTKKLCPILNRYGYNTVNIIGGYEAWLLNE